MAPFCIERLSLKLQKHNLASNNPSTKLIKNLISAVPKTKQSIQPDSSDKSVIYTL